MGKRLDNVEIAIVDLRKEMITNMGELWNHVDTGLSDLRKEMNS